MAFKMLDGNAAVAEAMKLARVEVIAAYPITPQSPISERLSEMVASGELHAKYIPVESEHTAISAVTAAGLTGARAGTATASNGLALMHEVLGMTSGNRVPVVMAVVNRGIAGPWTLWCDHGDTMSERDMGWLQFYCEDVQEILDMQIMAYKIAEHRDVLLPAMICLDGFFLSHSMQKVDVPSQEEVDDFLGEYILQNIYLDPNDPMFVCNVTLPSEFTEMRYQQKVAMDNALKVITDVQEEYYRRFGRRYHIVEEYYTEDADVVLVTLGSMSGTAKYVVNNLRKEGKKVGVAKITVFRPFPVEDIKRILKNKKVVGVFDRSAGLGGQGGPVWCEVTAALKESNCDIRSYIGGLGGRDVSESTLRKIFGELLEIARGTRQTHTQWIDVREDALNIREVIEDA